MSAVPVSSPRIRAAYRQACHLDVTALKPGNVSDAAPGHGMNADDFRRSAHSSAAALAQPRLRLGERIHSAVSATRASVGCNTNLGILLLCAPLAQACLALHRETDLRACLRRVLYEADAGDAEQIYAAIRLANPGGLGTSERHDVNAPARVALREAMAEAAGRDHIARQYASGFADVFDVATPALADARQHTRTECAAVTDLFLCLLSRFPDSHVRRKQGAQAAARLSEQASSAHATLRTRPPEVGAKHLQQLDAELKRAGINPGTTADLTVATLFLDRLLAAAGQPADSERRQTRGTCSEPYAGHRSSRL